MIMKTIEIKLAGLLFKGWYDKHSYEVYEIKRLQPTTVAGGKTWAPMSEPAERHVTACLTPEVLIAAEEGIL